LLINIAPTFERQGPTASAIVGVPEGYDAAVLGALAREARTHALRLIAVAPDDRGAKRFADGVAFFAPDVRIIDFPAWDCLPYDRVSPRVDLLSRRMAALWRLAAPLGDGPELVITTVSAVLQRVPPRAFLHSTARTLAIGDKIGPDELIELAFSNGYDRAETVVEPGEVARRGGIVDLFPPGLDEPVRIDFFGDEIESIRTFAADTQRSSGRIEMFVLMPVREFRLDQESIARFRLGYREAFGVVSSDDQLYEAVSEGRRMPGLEHWLSLLHETMETLFDHVGPAGLVLGSLVDQTVEDRFDTVAEYFEARRTLQPVQSDVPPYHPLSPSALYLDRAEWAAAREARPTRTFATFNSAPSPAGTPPVIDAGGRAGRDFADVRVQPGAIVFDAVRDHAQAEHKKNRRVLIAAFSTGSRERLGALLTEHGLGGMVAVESITDVEALPKGAVGLAVLGIERGFAAPGISVISEQDILGERLARSSARRVRPENVLTEASALQPKDFVVHVDHGIGRYEGLVTLQVGGAAHDCLQIAYDGDAKLFVPVENIEMLSRYGSEEAGVQLDRLGGAAWQARKARLKKRIRDMADKLIAVAALRQMRSAPVLSPPDGAFDEFCARFQYTETDDQLRAIEDVMADLESGRPMDRLICGDVGFGKTEVALRAAFIAALSGRQVAVVVPTTLLARQHHQTFRARFQGLPVRIETLSRLVAPKAAKATKDALATGDVDIVIGTHALLAPSIRFRNIGLLVIDEEQHFGVSHKERLKALRADVHVLTLSATPIPRTLQLALTGVRELSLIATPPVDRLAVRTFILPFDPVVVREALIKERHRGGQTFYVCPRIQDLGFVAERLAELVPEIKFIVAHGQMTPRVLEDTMAAFVEGAYDVLVSTNIIESGLDLPRVNTIIVHRADRFGLAQLYQLRGRVGRAKTRAYAYLTLPPRGGISETAKRRLEVMQSLDSLGAGFTLASHDLDIRGAGNLLGEEQSGHIREVGIELYQQMLEEAVAEARGGGGEAEEEGSWSPQISIGVPVLIPESYVADLGVRLALYRRIGTLETPSEIEAFAAEVIDRFGRLPPEVENLLQTVQLKRLCQVAGLERLDAGPKGAVVSFYKERFNNPAGLVRFITEQKGTARLRPDHRLVFSRTWDLPVERLRGAKWLVEQLAAIAAKPVADQANATDRGRSGGR